MRLVVILIAALWGVAAVIAFTRTQSKPLDAKLTAAYILLWPVLGLILVLTEPVPLWIAVPTMFGFIPWLMAGPHLWSIMKKGAVPRPDEVIGIPKAYWTWGGLGAILLGILFN